MTNVLVKSGVGPALHCLNLLDEILCQDLDSFTIVVGGHQISFNAAIMCSLSSLLSTLVKQIREDNCCTVHDEIFVFLPELRNWKTVNLLKTFLTSGLVDNISQVEIDDLQTLLQILDFNISCMAHPGLTVQAGVEDETVQAGDEDETVQVRVKDDEEDFFAEIKYEAEDEDDLLEKQDLFTRIQLERNDYEEIKNLIVSRSSGWIGNNGNVDQEMQNEDLEINQGTDGNLLTSLGESDRDHNYNAVNYCTEETQTKFTDTENQTGKSSKGRRLPNRKIHEKFTPTTDVMEVINDSTHLKPAPMISAMDVLESAPLLPNVTNDDIDSLETVSEDFEREQRSYSYSTRRNHTLSQQPKRKLPNRKTKHLDFEIKEKECSTGEAGKINYKVSRKGATNKAKEYTRSMEENLNERSGDNNKAGTSENRLNSSDITGNYGKEGEKKENMARHACEKCDYMTKNKSHLFSHIRAEHNGFRFACDKCEYKSKYKSNLIKHIKVVHERVRVKYSCNKCDFTSTSTSSLWRHKKTEHEGVRYNCKKCDFQTKNHSWLLQHMKGIHEGARYRCQKCNYKSKFQCNLAVHMKVEHDGVSYTCKKCDFVSKYNSYVKRHMQVVHEGIRYACEKCVFQSKEKSKLKIHIQAEHKGIRYTCEKCDFQTKYKSALSTHTKVQHEGVCYVCEECDYKSKSKSSLSKHIQRIHEGK